MVTSLKFVPFFMDSVSIQKTTTNRFKHALEANTRLALARIFIRKTYDLLILDEQTNHLDIETLTWQKTIYALQVAL